VTSFTPGVGRLDIGTSLKEVPSFEARALIAEMMVRVPEHRAAAMQELDDLLAQPKGDSPIIHRAKAWVYLQQKKPDDAVEELKAALELSDGDAWTHYYMAHWKYRSALEAGREFPGLANMLIDLRIVIDWYPDFAEAHNMLAMGRVEGGGVGSAVNAIRLAVELSPRNETYQLNMGLVNMAAKRWDVAAAVLERLKSSHNPEIAKDAGIYLDELPNSKKYGLVPKRIGVKETPKVAQAPSTVEEEDPDEVRQRERANAAPDARRTQFFKGRLLRVDCSQSPVAILTVVAAKTLRLRTNDYRSLLLVGADQFSCDWKNVPVTVNYKAGGKSDGDLVSLEIRE
jgi:tetratricopeptide (TPR) repeat protein